MISLWRRCDRGARGTISRAKSVDVLDDLLLRQYAVHEADAHGLLGVDLPAGHENVVGVARPYEPDEPPHLLVADEDVQLRHRYGEAAAGCGDTYIRRHAQLAPPSDAVSPDEGDRRLGDALDGIQCAIERRRRTPWRSRRRAGS